MNAPSPQRRVAHALGRAVAALVALVLAATLMAAAASPAAAKSPAQDFPPMPRKCATKAEKIPQSPVVCYLNKFKKARATVVLWGDSHAWMMIPAVRKAAKNKNVNVVATVMGGCPPMDNKVSANDQVPACFRSNAMALDLIQDIKQRDRSVRVILGGSWERYLTAVAQNDQSYTGQMGREMKKAFPRLIATLAKRGIATDVIGQAATVPAKVKKCKKSMDPYACSVPRSKALKREKQTRQWLGKKTRRLAGNRKPIDVNSKFCTKKVCYGKKQGTWTWFDDLHLSATRTRSLAGLVKPSVVKAIEANKPAASEPDAPTDTNTDTGTGGGDSGGGCSIPILCALG